MDECPICGGGAITITRGVPSYAFCINNHQWDRAKNIVYKKTYKELEQENENLRELVEEYDKYLIIFMKKTGVPSYNPENSHFIEILRAKLKEIGGE